MWREPDEFPKNSRKLKSAHRNASRQRSQPMLFRVLFDQLFSCRVDPFRIPRQLHIGKMPARSSACIQISGDNQIDDPLVESEIVTLLWQSVQPPSKKSQVVSSA